MISINLHNLLRPTFRIHNRVIDDLWMAFDLPDDKGNTVTVFIHDVEELRALAEVSREALAEFDRRVAIVAAFNRATEEPAPTLSLEKALGPVGSF